MINKKILITGVSSGIGKVLARRLVEDGQVVWGIARRNILLNDLSREINKPSKFIFSCADISKEKDWKNLVKELVKKIFIPDMVIFNAAILENDLEKDLDIKSTKRMMNTNFYGTINGVSLLLPLVKPGAQFLAISSLSALKGSGVEGIGYAASKAALSIGFESLYQKYKNKFIFKTIYFGPICTGMSPFKKKPPFALTENQAIKFIIQAINGRAAIYYYPKIIFIFLKFIKLLPAGLYLRILSKLEDFRTKFRG